MSPESQGQYSNHNINDVDLSMLSLSSLVFIVYIVVIYFEQKVLFLACMESSQHFMESTR